MSRIFLAVAAAFLALSLGACNQVALPLPPGAALPQPTLTPGTLPRALEEARVPAATQAKILDGVAAVQRAAARICRYVPLAEGVANIFIAQNSTSGVISANVQGIANLSCKALASSAQYMSYGQAHKLVRGQVLVNGREIFVYGHRSR